MDVIQLAQDIEIMHLGPSLEKGPLPAVFYFALSGQESLELDPYNQPIVYLLNNDIHLFSLNLPAHGPNLNALNAIEIWAQQFHQGNDLLTPFLDKVIFAMHELIHRGFIIREKIGLMGLSRGGFIAMHVAAKFPKIRALVSFAPMTELSFAREFHFLQEDETVRSFSLENAMDLLYDLPMRLYIGNRDTKVGTDKCFHLMQKLVDAAFEKGLRSPPIELFISPSIGHMGHGTSKEIFESGAEWIGKKLGVLR